MKTLTSKYRNMLIFIFLNVIISVLKLLVSSYLMIKFKNYHEGQLTKCKNSIVSNFALLNAAENIRLDRFICCNRYAAQYFIPVGYRTLSECREREFSDNTISDVAESLLGAYFLYSNENLDACWRNIILPFGIVNLDSSDDGIDLSILNSPAPQVCQLASASSLIESVQGILQYQFRNPILLLEALTHSSFEQTSIPCYQVRFGVMIYIRRL